MPVYLMSWPHPDKQILVEADTRAQALNRVLIVAQPTTGEALALSQKGVKLLQDQASGD